MKLRIRRPAPVSKTRGCHLAHYQQRANSAPTTRVTCAPAGSVSVALRDLCSRITGPAQVQNKSVESNAAPTVNNSTGPLIRTTASTGIGGRIATSGSNKFHDTRQPRTAPPVANNKLSMRSCRKQKSLTGTQSRAYSQLSPPPRGPC